jgi:hypothetical protein
MCAKILLELFDPAWRTTVEKVAPRTTTATEPGADMPVVAVPCQSSSMPNDPAQPDSAPRVPAGRVGAGSYMRIGDPDAVGASRVPGLG